MSRIMHFADMDADGLVEKLSVDVALITPVVLCSKLDVVDRNALLGQLLRIIGSAMPLRWSRMRVCDTSAVSTHLADTILRFMAAVPFVVSSSVLWSLCKWPSRCPQAQELAVAVVEAADPSSMYMQSTFPIIFDAHSMPTTFLAVLSRCHITADTAYKLLTALMFRHVVMYAYNHTACAEAMEGNAVILIASKLARRCAIVRVNNGFSIKNKNGIGIQTYNQDHIPTALFPVVSDASDAASPRSSLLYWTTTMQNKTADPIMQLVFLTLSASLKRAHATNATAFPDIPSDLVVVIMVRCLRMELGAARRWHQYRGMLPAAKAYREFFQGFHKVHRQRAGNVWEPICAARHTQHARK